MPAEGEVPQGLQGATPPVVLAYRHPAGPWLVVRLTAPHQESGGNYSVSWFPRASWWNCRPRHIATVGSLSQAELEVEYYLGQQPPGEVVIRPRRKSSRPRDSQRKKVYRSEAVLGPYSRSLTLDECRDLVGRIARQKRVQAKWPVLLSGGAVRVSDGRGRSHAAGNHEGIWLPRWARQTHIVLHELAHCIVHRTHGYQLVAGHGWEFCECMLQLVLWFMGREAHDDLRKSYYVNRIRYRPRRKLSEAHKEELRRRLAAVRSQPKIGDDSEQGTQEADRGGHNSLGPLQRGSGQCPGHR